MTVSRTAPTLLVFLGGMGGSPVEEMVAAARRAAAFDGIELALSTGAFREAILVSDDPAGVAESLPAGVIVDADAGPFHFGRRLAEVIDRHQPDAVVYLGAGSLPLLAASDFLSLAEGLSNEEGALVTNNHYSSDLVAFSPAGAVAAIRPPDSDNQLARALAEQASLPLHSLPRSLSTVFDIDGPTDLAVLSLVGWGGPRLGRLLGSLALDDSRYRTALPTLIDRRSQIVVAGRVSSQVWQYLERETACRVRLFAEERGMEADGRLAGGEVRSLLGFYLAEVGVQRLFASLAELGDATFLDTRVILAHLGIEASRRDRFLSDLGCPDDIEQPFLRQFTAGALTAPIPVLLGGHSLMAGGLMALNEFTWSEYDRRQQADK